MQLYSSLHNLAEQRMLEVILNGDHYGLVHLGADNLARPGFAQVSFNRFTHDLSPLFTHSSREEQSSHERCPS